MYGGCAHSQRNQCVIAAAVAAARYNESFLLSRGSIAIGPQARIHVSTMRRKSVLGGPGGGNDEVHGCDLKVPWFPNVGIGLGSRVVWASSAGREKELKAACVGVAPPLSTMTR